MSFCIVIWKLKEIKKKAIADYLIKHSDILKNRWIPCSDDNLPEKEVLCCDRYGEMMVGYVSKTEEGTYNAENEHEYMYDCVAWQPKPELYKP